MIGQAPQPKPSVLGKPPIPPPWAAAEEPTTCLLSRASYLLSSKGLANRGPRVQFPPTAAPRFGVPASCPRSTMGRPNADDALHFGAARVGQIDRSHLGSTRFGVVGPRQADVTTLPEESRGDPRP